MTTTVVLSDEQEQIREVARRYLQAEYDMDRVRELAASPRGFDEQRWTQISELGWTGIAVPESAGGMGYGAVELCLLMEEMGRVLLPAPFLSSIALAASVVHSAAVTTDAGARLLEALATGTTRAALVLGAPALTVDAETADVLVVAGEQGVYALEAGAAGVTVVPAAAIDPTRRLATVTVSDAATAGERLDDGADGLSERVALGIARGTVALAAEMVGATQRCVDETIAYVRDREQFGRPIGSFQAIKHRCADMAIEADAAREAVILAADVLDSGDPALAGPMASMAKATAGDALLHAAEEMIQMHGGIGYTEEHFAHLFYKRALVCEQLLGSATWHRDRLARSLDV